MKFGRPILTLKLTGRYSFRNRESARKDRTQNKDLKLFVG